MSGLSQATILETLEETCRRRQLEQEEQQRQKPKRQPRYQVILWDDDEHTYAYVIVMLMDLFGYPPEKGYQIARQVDTQGRAVVCVTTKEHAEFKRDQILAYGKDALIEECTGSMWATIEPVPEE
ncbi:MAG: ATP-dependent Clp protease adaptor ClpS [Thermoguttaceae bacterium]|nr:ATP-dependent Clp protease adaptor ClpS [Thermoguttaceae bacterium]MDW8038426.1 ATP-dependent Clp protease adaptor ClpS [Thermoguttaceae bacterium]